MGTLKERRHAKNVVDEKTRSEWELLITEWVHNEQDRAMLCRRLLDGRTFNQLSDEIQPLQIDQVKRRIYRAQEQLFKHI